MSARDYTTRVLRPIVNDGKIHRPGETGADSQPKHPNEHGT